MKISTKGRYALRLMLDVAMHSEDGNVSIKDIAERQDISIKYLEQIVSALSKAGYLRSHRGSQGGYRLTKKPEEYTVGDILRVTEGDMAPIACLEGEVNECPRAGECLTLNFWKGLYETINKYIDGTTLADILNNKNNKDYCYFI